MNPQLNYFTVTDFISSSEKRCSISLSYQVFGKPLHSAPIVLCFHALTGNSEVAGEKGWWKSLVKEEGVIDLDRFSVLCFNVPGNGYFETESDAPSLLSTYDVARLILEGLEALEIEELHSVIGGSIGGALAFQLLVISPRLSKRLIAIACHYCTSDWLYAQCLIQEELLSLEKNPIENARAHAMLLYRTPESLNERFKNACDTTSRKRASLSWLEHHGNQLRNRYSLKSYRQMNRLLQSLEVRPSELLKIQAEIHLIGIDSDLLFPASEMRACYEFLKSEQKKVTYQEIHSPHGHDAFLMEYNQLIQLLNPLYSI